MKSFIRPSVNFNLAIFLLQSFEIYGNDLEYGPSVSSLTSIYHGAKVQPEIWYHEALQPLTVHLKQFSKYFVLLPLVTNKVEATASEIFEEREMIGVGSFIIEAPEGYKISAVIQEMDLGLGIQSNGNVEQLMAKSEVAGCTNYLMFYNLDDFEPSNPINEVCGKFSSRLEDNSKEKSLGSRSFNSLSNRMLITFKFGNLPDFLRYNYRTIILKDNLNAQPGREQGPLFQLSLALTAFKDCPQTNKSSYGLTSCGLTDSKTEFCIDEDLRCDGIYNCGFDENFGADEVNCPIVVNAGLHMKNAETTTLKEADGRSLYWKEEQKTEMPHNSILYVDGTSSGSEIDISPNSNLDGILQSNFSPSSTILLIVFSILTIMILGLFVRFCCTKCVGSRLPMHNVNSDQNINNSSSFITLGSTAAIIAQMDYQINGGVQCARINYELDLPPAYEELFPPKKRDSNISDSISLHVSIIDDGNSENTLENHPNPNRTESIKIS